MEVRILELNHAGEISVVQLRTANQDTFEYKSLSTAIKNEWITVKEIDKSGSVNDVYVFNASEKFVFMMDGDIIEGAKQNRIINTSILLAPNTKTMIPVSCVERGRWRNVSDKFSSSDFTAPLKMRAKKSDFITKNMKSEDMYYADQSQVWKDVDDYSLKFNVKSTTDSLSDVYSNQKSRFDKIINQINPNENANGVVLFIDGKLAGADIFNRRNIYADYLKKIISGAVFELMPSRKKKKEKNEAELSYKALEFFDKLELLKKDDYRSIGAGAESRFGNEDVTGFELNHNNHLIHLSAMSLH